MFGTGHTVISLKADIHIGSTDHKVLTCIQAETVSVVGSLHTYKPAYYRFRISYVS